MLVIFPLPPVLRWNAFLMVVFQQRKTGAVNPFVFPNEANRYGALRFDFRD